MIIIKPYIYAIQFLSEQTDFEVVTDRGIAFGSSYADVAKTLEDKYKQENASIADIYLIAHDSNIIEVSEDTYNKLLNGDAI